MLSKINTTQLTNKAWLERCSCQWHHSNQQLLLRAATKSGSRQKCALKELGIKTLPQSKQLDRHSHSPSHGRSHASRSPLQLSRCLQQSPLQDQDSNEGTLPTPGEILNRWDSGPGLYKTHITPGDQP